MCGYLVAYILAQNSPSGFQALVTLPEVKYLSTSLQNFLLTHPIFYQFLW